MMIFIKLNIHKHNLYANINLNNAIIIMFSYYNCIIEITFQIAFRITFLITFEITFPITFRITFDIVIFITPVKLAGYSKHSKDSQKIVKLAGYSKQSKDSGKNLS